MAKKTVAIVGSYRKGGTVDQLVDAVLEGAGEQGAETKKIYLIDQQIEYCHNCRGCTQTPGEERGRCTIEDDMAGILAQLDSADAVVLASPVNFYNVTAVFRTFLERLVGCACWPWGAKAPKPRTKVLRRKAVLIASSAAQGFLLPIATGAPSSAARGGNVFRCASRGEALGWIGGAEREAAALGEVVAARAEDR